MPLTFTCVHARTPHRHSLSWPLPQPPQAAKISLASFLPDHSHALTYTCLQGAVFKVSGPQLPQDLFRLWKVPDTVLGPRSSTLNQVDTPALAEVVFQQGRWTLNQRASKNLNCVKC